MYFPSEIRLRIGELGYREMRESSSSEIAHSREVVLATMPLDLLLSDRRVSGYRLWVGLRKPLNRRQQPRATRCELAVGRMAVFEPVNRCPGASDRCIPRLPELRLSAGGLLARNSPVPRETSPRRRDCRGSILFACTRAFRSHPPAQSTLRRRDR